jgi:hypothetical protein
MEIVGKSVLRKPADVHTNRMMWAAALAVAFLQTISRRWNSGQSVGIRQETHGERYVQCAMALSSTKIVEQVLMLEGLK